MIIGLIYCELRHQYTPESLKELHHSKDKIAEFILYDSSNKLGYGHGVVFYEGVLPTKKELTKYIKKNKVKIHFRKLSSGNLLEPPYSYIKSIRKL